MLFIAHERDEPDGHASAAGRGRTPTGSVSTKFQIVETCVATRRLTSPVPHAGDVAKKASRAC